MPINDNETDFFAKFLNNQSSTNKAPSFVWEGRNHLAIHESDAKYCKSCFYLIELEAIQPISGHINVAS